MLRRYWIHDAILSLSEMIIIFVTYIGDISRKKKLLQKQAKGKKRMRAMGKVNVPQEAFMAVIQINDNSGNRGD